MSDFSAADHRFMARALQLARNGLTTAHPNPRVGCVLVRSDTIVGAGWHERTGAAHAEVNALAKAGTEAAGATAYVTLEPCSHQGRTGPCSRALLDAGVAQVICAMEDPSAHASGRGLSQLAEGGVKVASGLLRAAAETLNAGFLSRIRRGRPFVRLKIASSFDGATAMQDGRSQWISGAAARADVQRLRAMSGAILTGIGTVLADDPLLTVRPMEVTIRQPLLRQPLLRQPLRAIVDSKLRTPPGSRLLAESGQTAIFCLDDFGRSALESAGARVFQVAAAPRGVDLSSVLVILADEYLVNDLLVEAGSMLAGSLLAAGLVDELVIYQAPHIMGSETRGMFNTPDWRRFGSGPPLEIIDVRRVGPDTRITARPRPGDKA
ncbi:MAG: bifunctional diaminohydroxyphosphoribosylaminopyrimidine deaminase/5-amino-6-(5-phosphoribosylamino)uracil reductase RibD [Woeseia sp.]